MNENKILILFISIVLAGMVIAGYCQKQYDDGLKACYMQEPRTQDCEFMIWKYENRDKSSHHIMPVPVVIHH